MSRYLTSTKVGLLVLLVLYTDSCFPPDAIIPVLSFVTAQSVQQTVFNCDSKAPLPEPSVASTIWDFANVLKGFQSAMPGRTLHDKFLERLWAINSLHSLHDFFRCLENALAKPRPGNTAQPVGKKDLPGKVAIARVSPLGIFIRRAQLEFARLQFDDTVKLWTSLVQFRAPSEASWRKRKPSAPQAAFDCNYAELKLDSDSALSRAVYPELNSTTKTCSTKGSQEVEHLLEFQLENLRSKYFQLPLPSKLTMKRIRRPPSR